MDEKTRTKAVAILGKDVYRGFGPTLASEYLAKQHQISVSRETVGGMIEGKLWKPKLQHIEKIHP